MELFYKYGSSLIEEILLIKEFNFFLDLKLHDIPQTVSHGIKSLRNIPIDLLTVHLSGGREMLEYAVKSAKEHLPGTKIMGVSYLTSLSDTDFLEMFNHDLTQHTESINNLLKIGDQAGVQGIICSALDLKKFEKNLKDRFYFTCPGIRFEDELNTKKVSDQKRVATPMDAFNYGADAIVMGRSIIQSNDIKGRLKDLNRILAS